METERGASGGMGDTLRDAIPAAPQGAALGETVNVGRDRAGARIKDADQPHDMLAGCGVAQVVEELAENVRRHPITALVVGTGVGMFVGMVLATSRRAESE